MLVVQATDKLHNPCERGGEHFTAEVVPNDEGGGTDVPPKQDGKKSGGEKPAGATPKAKSMSLLDKLKMLDDDAEEPKDTE